MSYNWADSWQGMMFKCGDNAIISFTSVVDNNYIGGPYYNIPIFDKIYGSGNLYDTDQFVCIGCKSLGDNTWYVRDSSNIAFIQNVATIQNVKHMDDAGESVRLFWYTWDEIIAQFREMTANSNNYSCIVTIPDSIINIPNRMFYQCKISKLNLGDNLESIGAEAFTRSDLTQLASKVTNTFDTLTLPAGLSYIGSGAFRDNAYLKYINFKNKDYGPSNTEQFFISTNFRNIGDTTEWDDNHRITYVTGGSAIFSYDWFNNEYRKIVGATPDIYGYYHCYDSINGDQKFPLYVNKEGAYNKAYYIRSLNKTGYLKLVELDDNSGGNRIQYNSILNKSLRFKK